MVRAGNSKFLYVRVRIPSGPLKGKVKMKCPCDNCVVLPMCIIVEPNRIDKLIDKCIMLSQWLKVKNITLEYSNGIVTEVRIRYGISLSTLRVYIIKLKKLIPHLNINANI